MLLLLTLSAGPNRVMGRALMAPWGPLASNYLGWHLPDASLPFGRWAPGGLQGKCHCSTPDRNCLFPSHSPDHSARWQAAWHRCWQGWAVHRVAEHLQPGMLCWTGFESRARGWPEGVPWLWAQAVCRHSSSRSAVTSQTLHAVVVC